MTASLAVCKRPREDGCVEEGPKKRSDNAFLRAWAWKREHRPDKVRFHRPYSHVVHTGEGVRIPLTIHQARFEAQGFASTVWDSSIVVSKMCEWQAARWRGKRCLDLSAGCGLVGITLRTLGAQVTATDLEPNLPLLRRNCQENDCDDICVREHVWGQDTVALGSEFDAIFACDVMYIEEAIPDLVRSLEGLASEQTVIYVAHGRNRGAETAFLEECRGRFKVSPVSFDGQHPDYQTVDVSVFELRGIHHST